SRRFRGSRARPVGELRLADRDDVAGDEAADPDEAVAVHVGAVRRPQILDDVALLGPPEAGVPARGVAVGAERDVQVGVATGDEVAADLDTRTGLQLRALHDHEVARAPGRLGLRGRLHRAQHHALLADRHVARSDP